MIKLDHTIEALQLMLTLGLMYLSQLLVIKNHQCLISYKSISSSKYSSRVAYS